MEWHLHLPEEDHGTSGDHTNSHLAAPQHLAATGSPPPQPLAPATITWSPRMSPVCVNPAPMVVGPVTRLQHCFPTLPDLPPAAQGILGAHETCLDSSLIIYSQKNMSKN